MSETPKENFVEKQDRPGSVRVEKPTMGFGRAQTLGVFEGYQFFTPAAAYLHGRFTDEILLAFMHELEHSTAFMHHLFDKPIFQGLDAPNGDRRWNNALWAIEKSLWPAFESYVLSAAVSDSKSWSIYRYGAQDLSIVDPLWVDKTSIFSELPPRLDIVFLGVNSNRGIVGVDPSSMTGGGLPRVQMYKPDVQAHAFAALFFADKPVEAVNALLPTPTLDLPKDGINLRLRPLESLSPQQQTEYLKHIAEFKKGIE